MYQLREPEPLSDTMTETTELRVPLSYPPGGPRGSRRPDERGAFVTGSLLELARTGNGCDRILATRAWGEALARWHRMPPSSRPFGTDQAAADGADWPALASSSGGWSHGETTLTTAFAHRIAGPGWRVELAPSPSAGWGDVCWDLAAAYRSVLHEPSLRRRDARPMLRALLEGYRAAGGPARLTSDLLRTGHGGFPQDPWTVTGRRTSART
jgi:hypothetical protein